MAGDTAVTVPWSALRDRQIARLFYAALISQVGTQIDRVALLVMVYSLTHDPFQLSLILVTQLAATLCLGPLLSAWADGQDYRRLLVISDFLRAPLVLLIPLLGARAFWALLVIIALCEGLRALHDPVTYAIIPSLVPAGSYDSANSLMLFTQRFAEVAVVGAAGALVAAVGPAPAFWVDGASFVLSGLILLGLPALKPASARRDDYWQRVRAGLAHLWKQPVIRRTIGTLFAAALFGSVEAVLGVVLAVSVLKVGAAGFGVLEGVLALGAVLGTFLAPMLAARMPRERLFLGSLLIFGLVEASLGLIPVFGWAVGAYLVSGVLNMLFLIPARTLLQVHTPANMRARVFAAFGAVMQCAVAFGAVLGGALATPLGAPAVFISAGAAVAAICVAVALRTRGLAMAPAAPDEILAA